MKWTIVKLLATQNRNHEFISVVLPQKATTIRRQKTIILECHKFVSACTQCFWIFKAMLIWLYTISFAEDEWIFKILIDPPVVCHATYHLLLSILYNWDVNIEVASKKGYHKNPTSTGFLGLQQISIDCQPSTRVWSVVNMLRNIHCKIR